MSREQSGVYSNIIILTLHMNINMCVCVCISGLAGIISTTVTEQIKTTYCIYSKGMDGYTTTTKKNTIHFQSGSFLLSIENANCGSSSLCIYISRL